MFVAVTDTTSITLEWAMVELVKQPDAMKKAQAEVRRLVDGRLKVEESEIRHMEYLNLTIKETLRLHPPAPLLVLRECLKAVEIQGYLILAKSRVHINAWAIGRDPNYWDEAEEFRPERFMNSSMDFKGNDFRFIPFGAGRRGCPGASFAISTIQLALANLLHQFDWVLPSGEQPGDLNTTEEFGLTVCKKLPLLLAARPYFS